MRITNIELNNIGVFEQENITFQPCPTKGKAEIHIFTGTNGSGKSTLLYALAGFMAGHSPYWDTHTKLAKRFRFQKLVNTQETKSYLRAHTDDIKDKELSIVVNLNNKLVYFKETKVGLMLDSAFVNLTAAQPCNFAAFAYSAQRDAANSNIDALKEIAINPFDNALDFVKKINDESLNQWIANNISKQSIAKTKADKKKYEDNLNLLQDAISSIIGTKIEFSLELEPLNLVINMNGLALDFDVLPDGLRSIISWLGDLLMRMDRIIWQDNLPIQERQFLLFLDEIEVHLHIEWQRKILPIVQKLFPNAQIFISTHSPFVVNSVDDAWVYNLELKDNNASVGNVKLSQNSDSISYTLRTVFGVTQAFGLAVEKDLQQFYALRDKAHTDNLQAKEEKEMMRIAKNLAIQSTELQTIIQFELRQINRQTQSAYAL
jgi:predicted ATP-binding protein involved in virulence